MQILDYSVNGFNLRVQTHSRVWTPTIFTTELGAILSEQNLENKSVLDLGCGSGYLSIIAGKKGAKVVGLDLNSTALEMTKVNWELNNLPVNRLSVLCSDCFSALNGQRFNLIVSNPPTVPEKSKKRNTAMDWNQNGDGRLVLNALLAQGPRFADSLLTIATSKQGWARTVVLLNENWRSWEILKKLDLELAPHYDDYLENWSEGVFKREGRLYQRLYFIKGNA